MSLIRKHGAVLQAWACLDLVLLSIRHKQYRIVGLSYRKTYNCTRQNG